jgi:transcriptional regulator GlxA family with amidase domain
VAYVRQAGGKAEYVTSVCTGSFLLHRAGLLDGKRATTYWAAIEQMRRLPGVDVVEGERWVRDGNVITAAGVSAGIDMALYVIGQLLTPRDARRIQQYMEYFPAPPYADVPFA